MREVIIVLCYNINMLKKIIIFVVALFIFTLALFIWRGYFPFNKSLATPKMFWGVYVNGYTLNQTGDPYVPSRLASQVSFVKKLGVNIIRANYEVWPGADQVNNDMVDLAQKNHLFLLLVLESQNPDFFSHATYQEGYAWGNSIAARYKGRVAYYQMLNEVSGMAIKKDFPGTKPTDYDESKYQQLKSYLQGMAAGIKTADPKAKLVISANWIATAIIDRLYQDKVPFDIIGWNWFSDMGTDPTHKTLDDGTILDIPAHFAQMNKPFWLVEANNAHGDFDDPSGQQQATYLKTLADAVIKSQEVNAFIVFKLFDTISEVKGERAANYSWGLVKEKYDSKTKTFIPGDLKPAFATYQKIIKDFNAAN